MKTAQLWRKHECESVLVVDMLSKPQREQLMMQEKLIPIPLSSRNTISPGGCSLLLLQLLNLCLVKLHWCILSKKLKIKYPWYVEVVCCFEDNFLLVLKLNRDIKSYTCLPGLNSFRYPVLTPDLLQTTCLISNISIQTAVCCLLMSIFQCFFECPGPQISTSYTHLGAPTCKSYKAKLESRANIIKEAEKRNSYVCLQFPLVQWIHVEWCGRPDVESFMPLCLTLRSTEGRRQASTVGKRQKIDFQLPVFILVPLLLSYWI